MAIVKHKVLELSYINGRLEQPGTIVDFEEADAGANLKKATPKDMSAAQRRAEESASDPDLKT